jgi:hypothetical protein
VLFTRVQDIYSGCCTRLQQVAMRLNLIASISARSSLGLSLVSTSAFRLELAQEPWLTSRCERRADKRRRKPERADPRGSQKVHPSATRCSGGLLEWDM